jgi:hypothetical protein
MKSYFFSNKRENLLLLAGRGWREGEFLIFGVFLLYF